MSVVGVDEKQVSALIRRHEQVKRWEDSDTNLEPVSPKKDSVKVKFQDGCVFLAACSSGDKEEVKKLLQRGADINTANVDGLTALHQACIDDNIEMVEFLVEQGADVDVCDNEGWTPLHATASCAFTEIARYLIKHGANVAAVNNDGDLPSDIAENDEMEKLLKDEMKKQGIDENSAKCEEEQRMLEDANKWLKDKNVEEIKHPKTGASALHVAAAKGYLKVMSLLLEAGVDVNAEDFDGWTPLHAAAHWGQEEACKLLVENMCDMEHKNKAGHTAFDLADKDMLTLLEELKEKQTSYKNRHETDKEIILPPGHVIKRRSSVTRMSGDQKQNVIQRTSEEERVALLSIHPSKNEDKTANSISLDESEETETERKNEKNKQVSQQIQLQERLANRRPYSSTGGSVTTVTTSTMSTVTDKIGDRNSYTFGQNYTGLRTNRLSNYVPSYQARQQREANANSEDKQGLSELGRLRDRNSLTGLSSTSSSPSPIPASSATTSPSTNINSLNRRSFEPPKRDEETETQRKARAKHARQTRRSTQGVSLEDIEKAEEVLRSNDPLNPTSTYTSTSRTSVSTKDNGVVSNGQSVTTGIATTTTTTNSSCDNPTKEDSSVISGYRLRTSEDKSDAVDSPVTRSFRRAREDKDLTSSSNTSTDITSNYIPRSQRNSAILSSEPSSSITSSQSLLRTSSLRTNRVRNCETDSIQTPKAEEESRNDDSSLEKKDEKKESSSIRSRRQRRERRSTGIVYDNEEGELSKENKPEEDKSDNLGSSKYSSRFSSNSDAPSSDRTQRPTSYSEYSRSTGSLDIDYKKKYEDEKSENERLRKELEETKKSLLDAKAELDKVLKQREKEQPRNSERDKRTLERKISEMEEELKKMDALKADNQRLKDENGALIRVISKLSK
ncbi:protein phosphatase 1 regulatory subunit 12C-like isoform X16 [Biomphalaria glabrata]|uniref:Protein phosphatase 1 regulatory subunit 12B n=1 Tax=Biomphalaria glabrata TaxID=6526 RepID=A0A9W3AN99_BIOGL|nr:protein phosphatase 1 regulatory subunit 12C-like isoform X16 [Biomphalaria glabrata]